MSLCDTYIHSHRLIAFDNFFTSYQFLKTLNERGLYATGTVRGNRKGLPDILKRQDRMQRGEFMFRTKGCVTAIKWQDNKPVTVLSTYHNPKQVTSVKRKNRNGTSSIIHCPAVVAEYNSIMGGVDRFDQRRERYAIGRRSLKWWHRLLYFLIDLAIVNSFIMWNCNNGGQRDQLSFRLALVMQLTVGREIKRRCRSHFLTKNKPGVSGVPEDVRLREVGKHLPVRTIRRWCRHCSTSKHEARTNIMCSHCKVPLCVHPCFEKFHRQ
jgi:hypothetical protein